VFDRSLDCVAVDGHVVTCVGMPSDRIPQKLFRLNATLHFEFKGAPGVYGIRPESHGEILRSAALLADQGQLRTHVSRVLRLEEIAEGHRQIETARTTGKLVVQVR
jgi:NADPH:quinone reductase